jgi:hypothetical protein
MWRTSWVRSRRAPAGSRRLAPLGVFPVELFCFAVIVELLARALRSWLFLQCVDLVSSSLWQCTLDAILCPPFPLCSVWGWRYDL